MRASLLLAALSIALVAPAAAFAQVLPRNRCARSTDDSSSPARPRPRWGARTTRRSFNYTDYERNALRTIRLSLGALWQADRVAFVGELRLEDFDDAGAYRDKRRVRPFREHRFDLQAGRIPPVFGAFERRVYSSDRFLIGYLAYHC